LNVCNDAITNLRDGNAILHAKIVELKTCKLSTSTVEHVTICTRCRDINVDIIHDHLAMIKQQNDHITKIYAKIAEHELENEKFKFAHSMLYSGRRPGIKDGMASNRETMSSLMPLLKDCLILSRARLPLLKITRDIFYILLVILRISRRIHAKKIHSRKSHSGSNHAFMYKSEASSSRQSTHAKLPRKKTPIASNEPNISFKTFDASYVLTNKSGKVVAKYVGAKHKGSKTCVWVSKVLVSNVKGPKTVWVPKNKA
jgi:hypothetical protein